MPTKEEKAKKKKAAKDDSTSKTKTTKIDDKDKKSKTKIESVPKASVTKKLNKKEVAPKKLDKKEGTSKKLDKKEATPKKTDAKALKAPVADKGGSKDKDAKSPKVPVVPKDDGKTAKLSSNETKKIDTKGGKTATQDTSGSKSASATKNKGTKAAVVTKAPSKPDPKVAEQIKQLITDLKAGTKDDESIANLPATLDQLNQLAIDGKGQEVAKAVPTVVSVLESPKIAKNAEVQSIGFAIFWAVAFDFPAQNKDLGKSVIPLILKTLKSLPSDVSVQQSAYGALGNLAVNNEANKQLMVGGAPTIWKTVALLGTKGAAPKSSKEDDSKSSGKVAVADSATSAVESGLALLKMLANYSDGVASGENEDNKKEGGYKPKMIVPVAEAGELIKIMEKNATNANIQIYACGLIQNLGFKPAYAEKLVGAKKAILLTLTKHGAPPESIGALANLASAVYEPAKGKKKAFDDCVDPVVKAMLANKGNVGIQEQGCAALLSLSYLHEVNQEAVAKAKGIDAIVTAMKSHKDSGKCQRNACGALLNLSTGNPKNKKLIVSTGGIAAVITAMKTHPNDVHVQREGCSILHNLCQSSDRAAVEKAGAKTVIEAAIKTHKKNTDFMSKANVAMKALAGGSDSSDGKRVDSGKNDGKHVTKDASSKVGGSKTATEGKDATGKAVSKDAASKVSGKTEAKGKGIVGKAVTKDAASKISANKTNSKDKDLADKVATKDTTSKMVANKATPISKKDAPVAKKDAPTAKIATKKDTPPTNTASIKATAKDGSTTIEKDKKTATKATLSTDKSKTAKKSDRL